MKITPRRSRQDSEFSTFASLAIISIVIGALFFGKDVLVPFALALLLSFLLAPAVAGLERLKLGRAPAVVLVIVLSVAAVFGIVWVGTTQLSDIASNLPHYQQNIHNKLEAMRNPAGHGLARTIDSVERLSGQLSASQSNAPAEANKPLKVEVVKQQPGMVDALGVIGTSLGRFLGQAGVVVIFTLFMLMQQSDLRNRMFRLFGSGNLNTMTTALDDAAQRVSRYLLSQMAVNTSFGLLLGLGLYCIGVPHAPFWGVLGTFLRFIPYVGTLVAGICPFLLALAVFEGWEKPMLTFGVWVFIELVVSAGIEPWLYGIHTGISSLAILVSASFWTLLWGPIGLVLSTPLTVCLVVLGRYVPPLKFLSVLLGDEPALSPEACYYQRLLALDEGEAHEIAENYLTEKSVPELYDLLLIPALRLAEQDRHEHALDEEKEEFAYQTTRELIDELFEQTAYLPIQEGLSVLCVPARDEADELAALMLTHVLRLAGLSSEALATGNVETLLKSVEERQPDVLFVSALPPSAMNATRSLCRKARQRFPDLKIMIGFWTPEAEIDTLQKRFGLHYFDKVVTSLKEAEQQLKPAEASTTVLELQET